MASSNFERCVEYHLEAGDSSHVDDSEFEPLNNVCPIINTEDAIESSCVDLPSGTITLQEILNILRTLFFIRLFHLLLSMILHN